MRNHTSNNIGRFHGIGQDRTNVFAIVNLASSVWMRLCLYLGRSGETAALALATRLWQPATAPAITRRQPKATPASPQQVMRRAPVQRG